MDSDFRNKGGGSSSSRSRVLGSVNTNAENFDFDEILDRFEKRFGSDLADNAERNSASRRNAPVNDSLSSSELNSERCSSSGDGNVSDNADSSCVPLNAYEFLTELTLFFSEFCRLAHVRKAAGESLIPSNDRKAIFVVASNITVTRQLIRREIRTFASQLPEISRYLAGHDESGYRATLASLKRQVNERGAELEHAKRATKKRDIDLRNLRDRLADVALERDNARAERFRAYDEQDQLRVQIDELNGVIQDHSAENDRMLFQKKRAERCAAALRNQLLETHHERNAIHLEFKLTKDRLVEMERRNEENKKSESIILPKVQELQKIQEEMLDLMSQVGSGNMGARGALNVLNRKRTKLLNKLTTIIIKRPGESNEDGTTTQTRRGSGDGPSGNNRSVRPRETSSPNVDRTSGYEETASGAGSPNRGTAGSSSSPDRARRPNLGPRFANSPVGGLQRKMTNMFKGNGWKDGATTTNDGFDNDREVNTRRNETADSYVGSGSGNGDSRPKYNAIRYAGARAHGAAISDLSALREVMELREKELARMEEELTKTRNKTDILERELYKERQNRRRENRNLRGAELNEAIEMVESNREAFVAHNTLFDWQNNPAPGDGENTARIPVPSDDEEEGADRGTYGKDAALLSPVSVEGRTSFQAVRKIAK